MVVVMVVVVAVVVEDVSVRKGVILEGVDVKQMYTGKDDYLLLSTR